MKKWLWEKIFTKEIKNYYNQTKQIINEKETEINNLKERIKYLNLELERKKLK